MKVMDEIKYRDGEYVKVGWTDSILKIRYDFGKPGYDDGEIWYSCEKSEYSPNESSYYCGTTQDEIIEMATEKEFLESRKESFEFWLERLKESMKYYESEIEKINQSLAA